LYWVAASDPERAVRGSSAAYGSVRQYCHSTSTEEKRSGPPALRGLKTLVNEVQAAGLLRHNRNGRVVEAARRVGGNLDGDLNVGLRIGEVLTISCTTWSNLNAEPFGAHHDAAVEAKWCGGARRRGQRPGRRWRRAGVRRSSFYLPAVDWRPAPQSAAASPPVLLAGPEWTPTRRSNPQVDDNAPVSCQRGPA
jgi:hypothetical protein